MLPLRQTVPHHAMIKEIILTKKSISTLTEVLNDQILQNYKQKRFL